MPRRNLLAIGRGARIRGLSLMEVVITLAIILVLAGILLPILASSRGKATAIDDLSKMRQIGQAAALYESSWSIFPGRTAQLVAAGLIDESLCSAKADPDPEGAANRLNTTYRIPGTPGAPPPYRNSFIGMIDYGVVSREAEQAIRNANAGGWLIDVSESTRGVFPHPLRYTGGYKRLLFDGAVVRKVHHDGKCPDGPCRQARMLFADIDELGR